MSHAASGPGLRRLKASAREALAFVLYRSGVLKRLLSARLRDRAAVLMYHRVLPFDEMPDCPSHPGIVVSRDTFAMQMEWLSRNCRCLTLDEFLAGLAGERPFPVRSCLVTFDDGWRDNRLHALPVLERLQVPAVVFLTAGFIDTREIFWQERMTGLIRRLEVAHARDPRVARRLRGDPLLRRFETLLGGNDGGEEAYSVVGGFKGSDPREIEAVLERLSAIAAGPPDAEAEEPRQFMSWSEAREMARAGVALGSHGMTHRILVEATADRETEITGSKRLLEERLGQPVRAFCYPNGNYDDGVARRVRESGYAVAFSTKPGYVSAGSDAYGVRRLNVHETMTRSIPMFVARLAGLW